MFYFGNATAAVAFGFGNNCLCSGTEATLALWGERAASFPADGVLQDCHARPVVAIFVGMVMTPEGEGTLSGNDACRWYIDLDDRHAMLVGTRCVLFSLPISV